MANILKLPTKKHVYHQRFIKKGRKTLFGTLRNSSVPYWYSLKFYDLLGVNIDDQHRTGVPSALGKIYLKFNYRKILKTTRGVCNAQRKITFVL